jgi:hypothetical protein
LVGFLEKKKIKKLKEQELLSANIVSIHVRDVIQDFVILVTQILEILALNVEKQIFKIKKNLNN